MGLWFAEGWEIGWGECHVAVILWDALVLFLGMVLHLWAVGQLPTTATALLALALRCALLSPGTALAGELRQYHRR